MRREFIIISTLIFSIVIVITALLVKSHFNENESSESIKDSKEIDEVLIEKFSVSIDILRKFYDKMDGDNWIVSTGWDGKQDIHICDWYGIQCKEFTSGVPPPIVLSITLPSNNLRANNFDGSELMSIISLQKIDLSSNQLNGNVATLTENVLKLPFLNYFDMRLNSGLVGSVSQNVCDYDQGEVFKVDCDIVCKCCEKSTSC